MVLGLILRLIRRDVARLVNFGALFDLFWVILGFLGFLVFQDFGWFWGLIGVVCCDYDGKFLILPN